MVRLYYVSGDMGDDHSKEIRRSSSIPSENAEARMKFASVDALSELVWSPRNGLSLRCADFSLTGKAKLLSPSVFDDIAQTDNNMESHSKSNHSIQHQEEGEAGYRINKACSGRSNEKNRALSGCSMIIFACLWNCLLIASSNESSCVFFFCRGWWFR